MSGSNNVIRLDFAAAAAAADGAGVFNNPFPPAGSQEYQFSAPVTASPININGGGAGGDSSAAAVVVPQGHVVESSSEAAKKKRGRPRKYRPDGDVAPLGLAPVSPAAGVVNQDGQNNPTQNQSGGGEGALSPPGTASALATASAKKRGRPRGSLNKQHKEQLAAAARAMYTPRCITVGVGEDIALKIGTLSMIGPSNVCILSANGMISNVTLSQPASPGGTVRYEGRFEILSLSGSLIIAGNGEYNRSGGLSLTVSGPDGRVMGGGVVGACIAASPVQIVVLCFEFGGRRKESKSRNPTENLSAPPKVSTAGPNSNSQSCGTLSESSGGTGSPLNHQSPEAFNNNNNAPHGGIFSGMPWK